MAITVGVKNAPSLAQYAKNTAVRAEGFRLQQQLPPGAPPDVTVSALTTAATAINPVVTTLGNSTAFRYTSCRLIGQTPGAPEVTGGWSWNGLAASTGDEMAQPYIVDFMLDDAAAEVEIACKNTRAFYQLWIDGREVVAPTTVATPLDTVYRIPISLSARRPVHVKLRLRGASFYRVRTTNQGAIWRPQVPLYSKVAYILGDSYTAAAGDTLGMPYATTACDALGWEPRIGGQSGTGYTNAGGGTGGKKTFPDRILTDVVPENPDVVIILGSVNDAVAADTGTAATTTYTLLAANLPRVPVFVFGPQWPTSAANSNRDLVEAAVKASATAAPNVVKYTSLKGWITGAGTIGAPSGAGSSDVFTDTDGVHPSSAGHRYLGNRIAQEIAAGWPTANV